MLDIKEIQNNPKVVIENLKRRGFAEPELVSELANISREKNETRQRADELKATRNKLNKELGILRGKGEDISGKTREMKELSNQVKELDEKIRGLTESEEEKLLELPNLLDPGVPDGLTEEDNQVDHEFGDKPDFSFKPKPHWEILEKNGWVDFDRGAKVTGSKFYFYRGRGARLERAILNFMLDVHTREHEYEEVFCPLLVNEASMRGTGQFPKFRDEYYTLEKDELSLIPTAEVPLTNYYRDEILPEEKLPVRLTGATSCFRREAGAAGRDTRGLTRVHQFQKVELVSFCQAGESEAEHARMLENAESILKKLGLHYRVMLLCAGDTSAASGKTYDIEVWMPGQNRYVEISSVSNYRDFQARRMKIRTKPEAGAKPSLIHTLNGSGVAAGRALAAVVENYQTEEGGFEVPAVLKPYLGE